MKTLTVSWSMCLKIVLSILVLFMAINNISLFFGVAFGKNSLPENLSLQAPTNETTTTGLSNPAVPWMLGAIIFALIVIMVVTLWPNEEESNPYQRQRRFARVGDLFYQFQIEFIKGQDARSFLRSTRETFVNDQNMVGKLGDATLMSLSFGGATIISHDPVEKGDAVILHCHTLPDFPAKFLRIPGKIVWTRRESDRGKRFDIAGVKFVAVTDKEAASQLKKYLSFLMDEPVT